MLRRSSSPRRRAAAAPAARSASGSGRAASGTWAAVSAPAWACPWAAWWAAQAEAAARAATPSRPSPSTRQGSAPGGSGSSSRAWSPSISSSAPPRTLGGGHRLPSEPLPRIQLRGQSPRSERPYKRQASGQGAPCALPRQAPRLAWTTITVRATGAGGGGGGGALRRSGTPSSCAPPEGRRFRRAGEAAGALPRTRRRDPTRLALRVFVTGPGERDALLLPPHVLHTAGVEDVVMGHHVLHVRPHREVVEALIQGGPGRVQLDLFLHRHHEGEPLRGIQLHRLLVDHFHHLLVAVEAVVAR